MSDPRQQNTNVAHTRLKKKILETLCHVQNGSIKILKQDNAVIQINVSERINVGKQEVQVELALEA